MTVLAAPKKRRKATTLTVADLFARFGPMPLARIRAEPPPGMATEQDVLRIHECEDRLCELVDGILVEKTVGYEESAVGVALILRLGNFVRRRKLGIVTGADGMMKLAEGLIRIPDVAFVSWKRLPGERVPHSPIPKLSPNLAVEVLSLSNTPQEMQRKLLDYFRAGVELVWHIDPRSQIVEVFTAPDDSMVLNSNQTLTGGGVLPGFKVKVRELFEGWNPR